MMNMENTQNPAGNKDKRILLYEDDPEIRFLCKKILEKNQYRVEVLPKCDNVISDIESIKPNLILMDLNIPEIGGEKAIALIKSNSATSHIPVLLFSASVGIKEICKKVNADGYIEKPFNLSTFIEKVEQNLIMMPG